MKRDNDRLLDAIDFSKLNGLIPVITQEHRTKKVLMCAFANQEALQKTIETGFAHYFSRKQNRLWKKGEQSRNTQKIVAMFIDCDFDSVLYVVEQHGTGACHTGAESCFFNKLSLK